MALSNCTRTTGLLLISLSAVSCAGTDDRAVEEERYALLENQRIANQRLKQDNIRDALRAPMQTGSSQQIDIKSQQFGEWSFSFFPELATSNPTCTLLSEPFEVMSGDLPTKVQVIVTPANVYLRSDAVLSTDDIEAGFRVDSALPVAFDGMLNEVTATVDQGYSKLIKAMLDGTILTAYFSYATSEQTALDSNRIDIALIEFSEAYEMLSTCQQ